MALRILEGFDELSTRNDWAVFYPGGSFSGTPSFSQPGRQGQGGYLVIAGNSLDVPLGAAMDYTVCGVACKLPASITTPRTALQFLNAASTTQASLGWDLTGYPVLTIGASTLTGTKKIADGTWRYVEVKLSHSGGTLTMTLRIDEQVVATLAASASAPQITKLRCGTGDSTNTSGFDDVYVCDSGGSSNNDFLGDLSIRTVSPTGSSSTSGWTPTGAPTVHEAVDEQPVLNLADYITNASASSQVMFSFAATAAEITAVQALKVLTISQRTDAFSTQIQARVDSSLSTAQTHDSSVHGYHFIYASDPHGGAWTLADITGHNYGLNFP